METSGGIMDTQSEDKVVNIPVSQLRHFRNHPFKPCTGNYFDEMVASIKSIGIIQAIIVRPVEGEENIFEILSGHNRFEAGKKAGLTEVSAVVREATDDEAMEIVTETNFYQRSFADFSHSEKARAITIRHNALKNQGKRTDLTNAVDDILKKQDNDDGSKSDTSGGIPQKLSARGKIADEFGLDAGTVAYYLRISEIIPEMLERLDKNEFGFTSANYISFISKLGQRDLHKVLENPSYRLDIKKAKLLREKYKAAGRILTCASAEAILKGDTTKSTIKPVPVKLKSAFISKYYPDGYASEEEVEAEIAAALEYYRENKKHMNP
jgi:ParB family chromosome partitioning protein